MDKQEGMGSNDQWKDLASDKNPIRSSRAARVKAGPLGADTVSWEKLELGEKGSYLLRVSIFSLQ